MCQQETGIAGLERLAVLEIRDAAEDQDRRALLDAEVARDLGRGGARLDRARPAVQLG